jgi:hypothetical protein
MLIEKKEPKSSNNLNNTSMLFVVQGIFCIAYIIRIYRGTDPLLWACCCAVLFYLVIFFMSNKIFLQVLVSIVIICIVQVIYTKSIYIGSNIKKTGYFGVLFLIVVSILTYFYQKVMRVQFSSNVMKLYMSWAMIVVSILLFLYHGCKDKFSLFASVGLYSLFWWIVYGALPKTEITNIVLYFTNILFAILILS